jgi:hypothetical protein
MFNISILAAFKLMKTTQEFQQIAFEMIQDAESLIGLYLNGLNPSGEHMCRKIQNRYAYRCTSLDERCSNWEEEKASAYGDIEGRIQSGWYGGKW